MSKVNDGASADRPRTNLPLDTAMRILFFYDVGSDTIACRFDILTDMGPDSSKVPREGKQANFMVTSTGPKAGGLLLPKGIIDGIGFNANGGELAEGLRGLADRIERGEK